MFVNIEVSVLLIPELLRLEMDRSDVYDVLLVPLDLKSELPRNTLLYPWMWPNVRVHISALCEHMWSINILLDSSKSDWLLSSSRIADDET